MALEQEAAQKSRFERKTPAQSSALARGWTEE